MKRLSALLLVLVLLALQLYLPAPAQATDPAREVHIQEGVTLHCFGWSYSEIEKNMATIATAGYTAIQTSPIQRPDTTTAGSAFHDWIVYYQPASFTIDDTGASALGTKAEFEQMCATAERYGIKVIVDVVANHMAMTDGNDIDPAVDAEFRNDAACWHDITKNVTNYSDRYNITQYCLGGLPDLDTSNEKVQAAVLDFLKECVDAGADGFRFDAAKHIESPDDGSFASDFWPNVIGGIREYAPEVYIYGEFLGDAGGNLPVSAYTPYMSLTDDAYGNALRSAVVAGNAGAFSASYKKAASADKLVLWAESHDTFTGGSSGTVELPDIHKTWALVAARADAMSLYFARPGAMSQALGTASVTGWSNIEVAAVNLFHNAFIGYSEHIASQGSIAYVERGSSGVVLVNCAGNEADVAVTAHAMADGSYTDAITGSTFTVSGGVISGKIGATGIAVVYRVDGCAHASHDAGGICATCGLNVGHSYDEGGLCACGTKQVTNRVIYLVNCNWGKANAYAWSSNPVTEHAGPWPGTAMTKEEELFSITLSSDAQMIIFNDGSNKSGDLKLSADKNCYDLATNTWSVYQTEPQIPEETEPSEPKPTEPETVPETQPPAQPAQEPAEGLTWPAYVAIGAALAAIAAVVVLATRRKK